MLVCTFPQIHRLAHVRSHTRSRDCVPHRAWHGAAAPVEVFMVLGEWQTLGCGRAEGEESIRWEAWHVREKVARELGFEGTGR